MPSLMDKLRMIDKVPMREAIMDEPKPAPADCYRRTDRFPLSSFCDMRHLQANLLSDIYGLPFPKGIRPQDFLFLDTETTGLSGGAGTIAFEVGLGYVSGEHFVVEQFFMHDYPEEVFLLEEAAKLMRSFPAIVTFNGKTFDVPLLQNRFVMNRIADRPSIALHADVLQAARRVLKLRLGRCTLQRLEADVLGVSREDDLPGDQVPQTFFRYLKNQDFAPIERILEHNRQDVVSLAQLFFFLCKLYAKPEIATHTIDLFSMAKAMEKHGNHASAKKCYRLSAQGAQRANAYRALATQEKRSGATARAIRLYTTMLAHGDDPIKACEGLAMLYEHQCKNPEQALVYTRQALLLLSEPTIHQSEAVQSSQNALKYRYARLRRKIAGDAKA